MKAPRSALVVVPRRLGDVLLATPVMRSLRHAFPQCAIDALVFAGTEAVLAGNPDIRRVITIAERPAIGAHLALAVQLFRRYDLALSLVPGDRSTLYAWLAGRRCAGLVIDTAKHTWKKWLLGKWVPFDNRGTHTVIMHLRTVEALGVTPLTEVVAEPRAADRQAARIALAQFGIGSKYAVLHPFPKFRYKQWHDAGWSEVAHRLRQRGLRVVITGSGDAEERACCAALAARTGAANLAGALALPATAAVIAGAAIYIGPDTVTTHLAAASGVPTIALFGPGDPLKWGPWPRGQRDLVNPWRRIGSQRRGNVRIVQGTAPCTPCLLEGCDRRIDSASDCLTNLPARRVIDALEQSLTAAV
ncbi:MAG TPA: glycosyltransferase family 9 protein [Burkholderiales bacterium]|nr:glycosyltransferase family 9 protein [Burkholderiales bacterium]